MTENLPSVSGPQMVNTYSLDTSYGLPVSMDKPLAPPAKP